MEEVPVWPVQALWRSEKLSHFILRDNAMVTCLSLPLLCHECFRIKMLTLWVGMRFSVLVQAYMEISASQQLQKFGISFYVGFSDTRKETFF